MFKISNTYIQGLFFLQSSADLCSQRFAEVEKELAPTVANGPMTATDRLFESFKVTERAVHAGSSLVDASPLSM